MEPNGIDWQRLDRYVAGEGTPQERAALEAWVRSSSKLQAIVDVMRTSQRVPGQPATQWHARESWEAIAQRAGLQKPQPPRSVLTFATINRPSRWRYWITAAAVSAATVIGVFGMQRWMATTSQPGAGTAMSGREYVAPRGQRITVHLPDRTEITLAPETRVRLAAGYGKDVREVELDGHAYFVVTHDAKRPFSVRTNRIVVRDLGTRFSVRAYTEEMAPEVVAVLLEQGDVGRLTADGDLMRTRGMAIDRMLAWTNGELVLRRTPLRHAIVELSRWYDVDIQLADGSVANEKVTASFRDEPARVAIDLVAAAAGLSVRQTGSRYTLQRSNSR
jgi:transmembrane sensor